MTMDLPVGIEVLPCPNCGLAPTLDYDSSGYALHCYCHDCYDGPSEPGYNGYPIGTSLRSADEARARYEAVLDWNDGVVLFADRRNERSLCRVCQGQGWARIQHATGDPQRETLERCPLGCPEPSDEENVECNHK